MRFLQSADVACASSSSADIPSSACSDWITYRRGLPAGKVAAAGQLQATSAPAAAPASTGEKGIRPGGTLNLTV
jgi:hypothetical protein